MCVKGESDPQLNLGRVPCYHYTIDADSHTRKTNAVNTYSIQHHKLRTCRVRADIADCRPQRTKHQANHSNHLLLCHWKLKESRSDLSVRYATALFPTYYAASCLLTERCRRLRPRNERMYKQWHDIDFLRQKSIMLISLSAYHTATTEMRGNALVSSIDEVPSFQQQLLWCCGELKPHQSHARRIYKSWRWPLLIPNIDRSATRSCTR